MNEETIMKLGNDLATNMNKTITESYNMAIDHAVAIINQFGASNSQPTDPAAMADHLINRLQTLKQ